MSVMINTNYSQLPHEEPSDDVVTVPGAMVGVTRPWHYNLCVTCGEMNSCLECCICLPCQMSRQYNVLYNNEADLHVPVCFLLMLLDSVGLPAIFVFEYMMRSDIRRRYGIEGSAVSDCCISWLCVSCAVQQQFLELTSVGACPGMSMCLVSPIVPERPTMV